MWHPTSNTFHPAPAPRSFNSSLQCPPLASCWQMRQITLFWHHCLTSSTLSLSTTSLVCFSFSSSFSIARGERPSTELSEPGSQPRQAGWVRFYLIPSPKQPDIYLLTYLCTFLTGFPENSYLVYAILKYKQRFEAVREFTLESGQQEIERQKERWKAGAAPRDTPASPSLSQSEEDHLPSGARSPLTQIPEENSAFAIGDDDDDDDESDDEGQHTPSQSSPSGQTSRRPSIASTADETSSQLRGMSEKARGKKPAGQPSFSRQNSMTSQTSISALFSSSPSVFTPTVAWVSFKSSIPYDIPCCTRVSTRLSTEEPNWEEYFKPFEVLY